MSLSSVIFFSKKCFLYCSYEIVATIFFGSYFLGLPYSLLYFFSHCFIFKLCTILFKCASYRKKITIAYIFNITSESLYFDFGFNMFIFTVKLLY